MKMSKPNRGSFALKATARTGKEKRVAPRDPSFTVSPYSSWGEAVWAFDPPTAGQSQVTLYWDFVLHDGSRSTDPKHRVLLESFREICWGMLKVHSWWGPPLSTSTLPSFSVGLRDLFKWMVFRGYHSFGELSLDRQNDYLADLPFILTNRTRFYQVDVSVEVGSFLTDETLPNLSCFDPMTGASEESLLEMPGVDDDSEEDEDSPEEGDSGRGYSYAQASHRVNTIFYAFAQRALLLERGLPCMAHEPFGGKTSGEVSSQLATYVSNRLPPLPDEVAFPIVEQALGWIEYKARDVIALQKLYLSALAHCSRLHLGREEGRKYVFEQLSMFTFSNSPITGLPWREPIVGEFSYRPQDGDVFLTQRQVLRMLLCKVRDAAVITLADLVGLRPGEICSARVVPTDSELPSCIVKKLNANGTLELFFFKGIRTKGVPQPREEEWVVGCRPCGSTVLPLPVQAIAVVEEAWQPWREMAQTDRLFLSFAQPRSLPRDGDKVVPLTTSTANRGARLFIFQEVDLSSLPNINANGEELWRYRDSLGLNIKNVHWRKTFAAYVLESKMSLLPSVRQHFKHMNDAMTESGYFPAVYRLRQEADSFRAAETINWLSLALDGRPLLGTMAKLMDEYFDSEGLRGLTATEREAAISRVVFVHDLRIYFSDHGNCFIGLRPVNANCRKATNSHSWSAVTPDLAVRTPSMCSGCGCFAMDASHVPFWIARRDDAEAALAKVSPKNLGEFRVIEFRRNQAAQVVKLAERMQHVH